MTTHHDKQKTLQAHRDAEKAFFDNILSVIRAIFSNLTNTIDIINRYIGITGVLAAGAHVISLLPAAVLGPINSLFGILTTLNSTTASLGSKIVTVITNSGSSGTSIASLFLHSVAFPLVITGSALGLVKECFGLGELFYRRFAKHDTTITSLDWFNAVQGVAIASLTLVAASMMFFPPAIPVAYAIFAVVGIYRLLDSVGKNPVKMLLGLSDKKEEAASTNECSHAKMDNALSVKQDKTSEPTPTTKHEKTTESIATSKPIKIESHFKPGYFSLRTTPSKQIKPDAEEIVINPTTQCR